MTNTCVLGVTLEVGMPVAVTSRSYGGGINIDYRGTLVGFKVNPKSTSAKIETWCTYDKKMKVRTAKLSSVVTDAKAILSGNS